MKRVVFLALFAFITMAAGAQTHTYVTTGFDFKLQGALLDDTLSPKPSMVPRASLWFNFNEYLHVDVAESFGFFVGIGVSNNGFIAQYDDSLNTKVKYRTYNAEVPIGFKIGKFDSKKPLFFFAGAAMSVPVHYKEKVFFNDKKQDKLAEWFSDRVNFMQPSAFFGITFPNKSSLKFQYYFMDFMNNGFEENIGGVDIKPYGHMLHSNIISVSYGGSFTGIKKK